MTCQPLLDAELAGCCEGQAAFDSEAVIFALAMKEPCSEHHAPPGTPCWRFSSDRIVCALRISRTRAKTHTDELMAPRPAP
jgi:hypothetical protein